MAYTDNIRKPIGKFLEQYNLFVEESLRSDDEQLSRICQYILSNRGKGLRPLLAILVASLHGTPNNKTFNAAFLLEMVHTASLVHDDVVDEALVRRAKPSVNALWGPRTAVLVGDYIISRVMCNSLDSELYTPVKMVCQAIFKASEGELAQSRHSELLDMDTKSYFDIIQKKTAFLFGVAAAAGAYSVEVDPATILKVQSLGENIGIAFQIRDDILDYTANQNQIGKPACGDLKEKKITLPLLHLLDNSDDKTRAEIIDMLSRVDRHPEYIDILRQRVCDGGGIEYSRKVLSDYCNRAKATLEDYEQSDIRQALEAFVEKIEKE